MMGVLKIYKRAAKGVGRLVCYARRNRAVAVPGYEQDEHCQIYSERLQGKVGGRLFCEVRDDLQQPSLLPCFDSSNVLT